MRNLYKYDEYISEKVIYDMITESKLIYSSKLLTILNRMNDEIAKKLISLSNSEVDGIVYNYIDSTDDKSKVSFTPDTKAQKLKGDRDDLYKIIDSARYLTHSVLNNRLFSRIGYEPNGVVWVPPIGTIGVITKRIVSNSGKIYCLFVENTESKRTSVINEIALEQTEFDNPIIWTSSRNPINIGRLTKAILSNAGIEATNKEIEDFVNKYKATHDLTSNILMQIDIVEGDDIKEWYDEENYTKGSGSLNNSCMSNKTKDLFDIYSNNNSVRMVILYSDDGELVDGKYTSGKIKGRAILWDCFIDDKEATFMDRIYTILDYDVKIFEEYAINNKWWFKKGQDSEREAIISNGDDSFSPKIEVRLDNSEFSKYPYLDTLCYLDIENDMLSNVPMYGNRVLRTTDGSYLMHEDDEDDVYYEDDEDEYYEDED